jgi:glucose-1-phosphate thymidylyltransferase
MKGIILAGGSGERLKPSTSVVNKQLLPVFDKPMIYYAISTLMLGGIKEILIICTPQSVDLYKMLLGDGSKIGVNLSYAKQTKPNGIPEALIIAENFLGNSNCVMLLGDNFFYGDGLRQRLRNIISTQQNGAAIFGYKVINPEHYGVIEFDGNKIKNIEEKPKRPKSRVVVTGLYLFDNQAPSFAKKLNKSNRGELEIIDLLLMYLKKRQLNYHFFGRGYVWLDLGDSDRLLEASNFVQIIQQRQGTMIGCPEEVGMINGWVDKQFVAKQFQNPKNVYSAYVKDLCN